MLSVIAPVISTTVGILPAGVMHRRVLTPVLPRAKAMCMCWMLTMMVPRVNHCLELQALFVLGPNSLEIIVNDTTSTSFVGIEPADVVESALHLGLTEVLLDRG